MNHGSKSNEAEEYKSDPKTSNKLEEIMSTVPKRKGAWLMFNDLYLYEGFLVQFIPVGRNLACSRPFQASTQRRDLE